MTEFEISTSWLVNAWFGCRKHDVLTRMCISKDEIKITAFPKNGGGMRVSRLKITSSGFASIEVSDALRAFVKKISIYPVSTWSIQNKQLTISVESSSAAMHYTFPKLHFIEDNYIPDEKEDIHVSIVTRDWFDLWQTIPPKGLVKISISKQSKVISMNHLKGRWKGAIFARKKPSENAEVTIDTSVAKSVFVEPTLNTFSELIFKKVGVFQWKSDMVDIYVAPYDCD